MDEAVIARAARALMHKFGDGASKEASERADSAEEQGDIKSAGGWQRVLLAIHQMQRKKSHGEKP
jgi:hypothetical protein